MLDFIKGIACICVVFIHVTFPNMFGLVVKNICGYAVPVFFMIAGYYVGGQKQVIKRRLYKILRILMLAYIIFFCIECIVQLKNNNIVLWLHSIISIKVLVKFFVFCTIDFAIPLWYLIAQSETYIFWYLIVKFKLEQKMLKVMPLLFVFQIILRITCETINCSWFWKINFVTGSLTWFLLGYYIYNIEVEKIKKIENRVLLFAGVIGMCITCIPIIFSLKVNFSSVGYIPYATAIFLFAIKNDGYSISQTIEYLGGKLSLWVYIFHVPMSIVISYVCSKILKIDIQSSLFLWCFPIVTAVAVIIFSYLFEKIIYRNVVGVRHQYGQNSVNLRKKS